MNPEISVLVPVYNVEKYIQKCVESLFNNTIAASCEFIFTNDGSTDKSLEILNNTISQYTQFKDKIRIINHEKNYGIGKTRNTCLSNAKGQYIIFVDSDDWVENDYLEQLLNNAKKNNADVTGCDIIFEYDNYSKVMKYPLSENPNQLLYDVFDGKIAAYLFIKLIRRNFLLKNNILFSDDIRCLEDLLFFTRILLNNPKIYYFSKALYHYLIRNGSILHSLHTVNKADNIFLAINYIQECLNNYNDLELIKKFKIRTYIFKYEIITKGTKQTHKKYLNMYPELNTYMNKNNTKFFYLQIFKIHKYLPKFAFLLLVVFSTIKGIFGRIDLKKYYTW